MAEPDRAILQYSLTLLDAPSALGRVFSAFGHLALLEVN